MVDPLAGLRYRLLLFVLLKKPPEAVEPLAPPQRLVEVDGATLHVQDLQQEFGIQPGVSKTSARELVAQPGKSKVKPNSLFPWQ